MLASSAARTVGTGSAKMSAEPILGRIQNSRASLRPDDAANAESRFLRTHDHKRFRPCIVKRYFLLDTARWEGYSRHGSLTVCFAKAGKAKGRDVCGVDLLEAKKGAYICFCETNPPFSGEIFDVRMAKQGSYGEKSREISVGSFSKTNPVLRGYEGGVDTKMGSFFCGTKPNRELTLWGEEWSEWWKCSGC
jgi:hypothetical protein